MILDRLETVLQQRLCVSEALRPAIALLRQAPLDALAPGSLSGEDGPISGQVLQRPLLRQPELWEVHQRHIDLHLVLQGSERIRFCLDRGALDAFPYDAGADARVGKGLRSSGEVTLRPGEFLVLFPGEIHQTGCPAGSAITKKLILKIPYATL